MSKVNETNEEILEKVERKPCDVFSRSMGYYRPTSNYNVGKKQEYEDRKEFVVGDDA